MSGGASSTVFDRRFALAMLADEPVVALRELAMALRDGGMTQVDLYLLFERRFVQAQDEDANHEQIQDVLDLIWSGPWAKGCGLFETELSDAAVSQLRDG